MNFSSRATAWAFFSHYIIFLNSQAVLEPLSVIAREIKNTEEENSRIPMALRRSARRVAPRSLLTRRTRFLNRFFSTVAVRAVFEKCEVQPPEDTLERDVTNDGEAAGGARPVFLR